MTTKKSQTTKAYDLLLTNSLQILNDQDAKYDSQDNYRNQLILQNKQKTQKRIDLQKKCGQMLTRTQLENVDQKPQQITNVTLRRAIRNSEFQVHGAGCSVQEIRHCKCKLGKADIDDAISLTENTKTSKYVLPQSQGKKITQKRTAKDVLNHFKEIAGQYCDDCTDQHDEKCYQNPTVQDIQDNELYQEYLVNAKMSRLTPSELQQLADQEKMEHFGKTYLTQKFHTIMENDGNFGLTNTRSCYTPNPMHSPKSQTTTLNNYIPNQSVRQLLISHKFAQITDQDKVLDVQQAPEATLKKRKKNVMFAPESMLTKGGLQFEDSDVEENEDEENSFNDLIDPSFNDEVSRVGGKQVKSNETSKMIALFEKQNNLDNL